jgi:hypothetical protein
MNVTSGNAIGNDVNASFIVPHAPEGNHSVTIIDITTGEKDTVTFEILLSYSFKPLMPESPVQIQEGGSVTISVNVTGGRSNYVYPKIKVQTPSENLTYEASNNITTNDIGDFYGNFTYPNDFLNGANTNFTGLYKIIFNVTFVGYFFIGLTDRSEYHRSDIVNVKAVDYPPNENVTLTIKFGEKIIKTIIHNAINGVINVNWTVPPNATIGNYTLSISPVPDSKLKANDTQSFKVPGFETKIFTHNLANETVPNVLVKVYDKSANAKYSATSNKDGLVTLMLERGNHSCEAFFKEVKVREINFTITEEKQMNLTCQLTSLNIKVIDTKNVSIPEASISLIYNYTTNLDKQEKKTGIEFGQTNITGTLHLRSLLPNVPYIINASRYGRMFNQDMISDLPAQAYFNITIICPTRTLYVNIIDAYGKPIENSMVKTQELMYGPIYGNSTDGNGKAVLRCTFGRYFVKVYVGEMLLNETSIDLFDDQNITIRCILHNLLICIKVVDYFGQPIQNANVTLERDERLINSAVTGGDGITRFTEIGGTLTIKVYLADQNQPAAVFYSFISEARNESNPIEVRLPKYVILAGFLLETSQFTTVIMIAAAVILILLIEVYRRKHITHEKGSS